MLVRLTELKGQPVWINPVHVKAVRSKSKFTEIIIPMNSAMGHASVKVKESAEETVELLNAGMPDLLPPLPPDDEGGPAGGGAMVGLLG